MSLAERIALVNEKIAAAARQAGREPSEVTLVAATKVQTSDTIRQAIAAGVTICGENRVQEMTAHLDDDAYAGAALHFIGHLQTNKVRQVVGRVELIESVGSEHLLEAIEARPPSWSWYRTSCWRSTSAGRHPRAAFPRRSCPPWPPRRLAAPMCACGGSWQSLPWPPGRTETARFLQKCVSFMLT